MKYLCVVLVALLATEVAALYKSSVKIDGRLVCNGKSLKDGGAINVTVWDRDTFTPDDKVASGQSNRKGYFYVNGSRNELTGLDLYFQVEGAAAASNCKNVDDSKLAKIFIDKNQYSGYCHNDKSYKYYSLKIELTKAEIIYKTDKDCPKDE